MIDKETRKELLMIRSEAEQIGKLLISLDEFRKMSRRKMLDYFCNIDLILEMDSNSIVEGIDEILKNALRRGRETMKNDSLGEEMNQWDQLSDKALYNSEKKEGRSMRIKCKDCNKEIEVKKKGHNTWMQRVDKKWILYQYPEYGPPFLDKEKNTYYCGCRGWE